MIEKNADLERAVATAEHAASMVGFYLHIPFCARRCGYCDFASFARLEHLADEYIEAVGIEVERTELDKWMEGSAGSTLYVGGGTPTHIDTRLLAAALEPLLASSPCEITVEANPDDIDRRTALNLASIGVDRVSLGVQSFDPAVLEYLDRTHEIGSVYRAVDAFVSAGIENLNLDLIYGAPPESLSSWERTLMQALELRPTHLSCYALSIEKGTELWRCLQDGSVEGPDPDDQSAKMDIADEILSSAGYQRYEVSAWALPGYECLHNLLYWGSGRYRGFGAAAHSFDGKKRFWNPRHPRAYIQSVADNTLPCGEETLDGETLEFDRIAMGLRRSVGIEISGGNIGPSIRRAIAAGLARLAGGRLLPTSKGMALLNELVVAVVSDGAAAQDSNASAVRDEVCVLSL